MADPYYLATLECGHELFADKPCPYCCIAELEGIRRDALEIYAGMEGFKPETAPEAYCLRIIDKMVKALLVQIDIACCQEGEE